MQQSVTVCILVVLFGVIVLSAGILGAPHNEVEKRSIVGTIPTDFKKDPWLVPKIGVLASEHSPVYHAVRGGDGRIEFRIVPDAIKAVAEYMLTREEYREAYAENVNNPKGDPIQTQKEATPLPESGSRPDILYPEIMVVVTYDLYKLFEEDMWQTISYLLAFWNGVDMMYRGIKNPIIRLNVAGIILETEDQLLEYTAHHQINDTILKADALYKSRDFWYNQNDQIPVESYDQIVTLTTMEVCGHLLGPCERSAIGQSFPASMCQHDDVTEVVEKTSIIVDNANFDGVVTAAHELGHALGMNHDNAILESHEITNIPNCKEPSGIHIMTSYLHANSFKNRWSACSMDYLDAMLRNRNVSCLYNTPAIGEIHIPRLLPGKLTSLDEQCRAIQLGNSCVNPDEPVSPCQRLSCWESSEDGDRCVSTGYAAAEGTPCDGEHPISFCMFGECVSESKFL